MRGLWTGAPPLPSGPRIFGGRRRLQPLNDPPEHPDGGVGVIVGNLEIPAQALGVLRAARRSEIDPLLSLVR